MFQGFLNLHKPSGMTSHDCISRTRRLLKMKKVGHGGTLDPSATGVLPIALGHATRLLQYLSTQKAYRATIQFGITTTTDDLAGDILTSTPSPILSFETVQAELDQFQGKISQVPPNYSAIQINGKRQYELARAGKSVTIASREVEVHQITVRDWRPTQSPYPELDLEISCGPGTYIRSIARDLGHSLGTGGTLAGLIRTESCGLRLDDSLTFEELESQIETRTFKPVDVAIALQHMRIFVLDEAYTKRWFFGQRLPFEQLENSDNAQPIYVTNERGDSLGVGLFCNQVLSPKVVIPLEH